MLINSFQKAKRKKPPPSAGQAQDVLYSIFRSKSSFDGSLSDLFDCVGCFGVFCGGLGLCGSVLADLLSGFRRICGVSSFFDCYVSGYPFAALICLFNSVVLFDCHAPVWPFAFLSRSKGLLPRFASPARGQARGPSGGAASRQMAPGG